jgi:hypothetical protein
VAFLKAVKERYKPDAVVCIGDEADMHALSYHAIVTHNRPFGRRVFPAVSRGVAWLEQAHLKDPYGLMPPSWPYDNEMILGRYTSHNLWCLLGLRSAIRLARFLGESETAEQWLKFENEYSKAVIQALQSSALKDGSVPPGLYAYRTGEAARSGFKEYQTNQDWENMLLAAPTEVLFPYDPLITATLKRLHKTKFREGVMTYRNGQHLHQYITANVMEQEMARGDEEQALIDLYHMLLHNGPTGEGFENLVQPWTRQVDLDCPPPHAWAAMKTALVIRNTLLVERGGRAGIEPSRRNLVLFSLLAPEWTKPGKEVGFRNAPCEMGSVSATFRFSADSADLTFAPNWNWKPHEVIVPIPWYMDIVSIRSDANVTRTEHSLILSPNFRTLHLGWKVREGAFQRTLQNLLLAYRREPGFSMKNGQGVASPGVEGSLSKEEQRLLSVPISFSTVLKAYNMEYLRRFKSFVAKGGVPVKIALPGLH